MEIVDIFAPSLYAFHFPGEVDNEYDRNIELWTDVSYLKKFAEKYIKDCNIKKYIQDRLTDAEQIIDKIELAAQSTSDELTVCFQPLDEMEQKKLYLPFRKWKIGRKSRTNHLRFYAIKIDADCYVITGGAIKVSQKMQENELTQIELEKLHKCRAFLNENNVFDNDSFQELIIELQ